MLKRIRIKGYKSLADVEVELQPLSVLFGPNAAGKSNFLDALQLLSKIATSRTLKEAFDPPHRGKPLESFTFGPEGVKGLRWQERLRFSIEADFRLSDAVVEAVNRQVREMRPPSGYGQAAKADGKREPVRERNLRYRVEIEMMPQSGILRVADESLVALNARGEPGRRKPFIERQGEQFTLRPEVRGRPDMYLYHHVMDRSLLSIPHYPPHHPHVAAARQEMESWQFFYFEPRERMRAVNPVKEASHTGFMGEELAAFLNTLNAQNPKQLEGIEKALHLLIPAIDGIEINVNDLGEVELHLKEGMIDVPSRVLSDGTLRMLGLLALAGVKGAKDSPAMIGLEEPENGVHPRRIQLIAEFLKTQAALARTQYLVTTHSPILPDFMAEDSLFVVRRIDGRTRIDPFSTWGPLAWRGEIGRGLEDIEEERLLVSERAMRGDFDADP